MSERKLRILVAEPGLDGHDRGAKVVARALAEIGVARIFTPGASTREIIDWGETYLRPKVA